MRDRIRMLGGCDRLLLLLTAGCAVLGVPGNYLHSRHLTDATGRFLVLLAVSLRVAIAGVAAYTVVRRRRRPADYGFSLHRGGLASLAALAAIHVYLVISGRLALSTPENFLLIVWSAFMEELAFRAIAIDTFIRLLDGMKGKALWAILASSVMFSFPHITSKSPAQLQGIFFASLILGYVYYKSRSLLLPAWMHATGNAGYLGGIVATALWCLISFADWTIAPSWWGRRFRLPG